MSIKEVHNHLIDHNIKPSMQRVAIMRYLMDHRTHPTIDQIFNDLLPEIPMLSKTTVYNTLKLFYDKKAVLSLTIDEKNVRYDADTSIHAHFRCKLCGNIHDIPLKDVEMPFFKEDHEFSIEEKQVYFIGVCKQCKA
jgi:Fur family ferric uptake transcriptional regulator/Fur family peroxide stress response transcriptional regulator